MRGRARRCARVARWHHIFTQLADNLLLAATIAARQRWARRTRRSYFPDAAKAT
jgi:hypothetical protein